MELKGLEPGQRYGAWMPPHEGRYLWVEFAAEAGTVEVERREGGVVTGRVHDLPAGSRFARVSLSDDHGREVSGVKTDAEGRFEVRGLPSAQWTVRATHEAPGGKRLVAEGRAATGGDVELRLVAAPRRAWVEEAEDDGWDDGPALPEPAAPPVVVPAR